MMAGAEFATKDNSFQWFGVWLAICALTIGPLYFAIDSASAQTQGAIDTPSSSGEPVVAPQGDSKPADDEPADDEPAIAESPADTAADSGDALPDVSPLTQSDWRGRTPRWIGVYGSQIADLVPEDFRPISINELSEALPQAQTNEFNVSERPVSRCVVFATIVNPDPPSTAGDQRNVDGPEMRSLITQLSLPESDDPGAASVAADTLFRLGPINLPIDASQPWDFEIDSEKTTTVESERDGLIAEVLSGPDGQTYVVGNAGSNVNLEWTLRSRIVREGSQWTIRLPDASVREFYLNVGPDQIAEVDYGTSTLVSIENRTESDPPIDTTSIGSSDPRWSRITALAGKWYRIEPSHQRPFHVTVRPDRSIHENSGADRGSYSASMIGVRGCRMTAVCVGDQLSWTVRLTLDRGVDISPIRWGVGEVISTTEAPSSLTSTILIFEGVTSIDPQTGLIALPFPEFDNDQFLVPPQIWQLQLDVPSDRVLTDFDLPPDWVIRLSPSSREGVNGSTIRENNLGAADVVAEPVVPADNAGDSEASARGGDDRSTRSGSAESTKTKRWIGSGPAPIGPRGGKDPEIKIDPEAEALRWSVTAVGSNHLLFAQHQVRIEMDEMSIQARAEILIQLPKDSVPPIELKLQEGFQFDFIGVGETKRNVTDQIDWVETQPGSSRRLLIWVGADEVVDGHLTIHATAAARVVGAPGAGKLMRAYDSGIFSPDHNEANESAITPRTLNGQQLPPLWLIRVDDCPGQLLASIIPPANLTWTAEAAIEPDRMEFSELTIEQRRFFAPLPGDAIVFGGAMQSTPVVELENPDINLSVNVRTVLSMADVPAGVGSTVPIEQTIEIKTEGTSGAISSLRVRFAGDRSGADDPGESEGDFNWAIQMRPQDGQVPIANERIDRQWIESDQVWEVRIGLPPQHSNKSRLIGYRRTKAPPDGAVRIGLPNIPDAVSKVAEVWIEPSLQIQKREESLIGFPSLSSPHRRYRYTADDQPWIEVGVRETYPPETLVIQQRLRSTASVCGTDIIRLDCLARTDGDLRLSFPATLRLTNIWINNRAVESRSGPGVDVIIPHQAMLAGDSAPTTAPTTADPLSSSATQEATNASESTMRWVRVRVEWMSPSSNDRWLRWYRFPSIGLNEIVLDAREELVPAAGTTALQAISWPWRPWRRDRSLPEPTLLLPTGFLGGIGWIAAFVLLGLSRWVGRRGIRTVWAGVLLSLLAACVWPATATMMAAFVALPLTIAAIQTTSSFRQRYPATKSDQNARHGKTAELSGSFSLSLLLAISGLGTWMIFATATATAQATAADTVNDPDTDSDSTIDILVPLKKDGSVLGDKVYVPEVFYNELLFEDRQSVVRPAWIQRAQYRLRLRSMIRGESMAIDSTEIVSRLRSDDCVALTVDLHVRQFKSASPQRIRLPYRAADVETVRIGNSISFGKDDSGWLVVETPPDEHVDLTLTLRCDLDWESPWAVVRSVLPVLPMSTLIVQAEAGIDPILWEGSTSDDSVGNPIPDQFLDIETPSSNDPFAFDSKPLALGTMSRLDVRFQFDAPFAYDSGLRSDALGRPELPWNQPDRFRTRYWVYVQPDRTVVECEIEPTQALSPQSLVILQTTDADVRLLSGDYRWLNSDSNSNASNHSEPETSAPATLKLVSLTRTTRPIRLAWTILNTPSVNSDAALNRSAVDPDPVQPESLAVRVPEVWVGQSGREASAADRTGEIDDSVWMAWTFSKKLQPDWSLLDDDASSLKRLPAEQFYAVWNGHLRSIDRANMGWIAGMNAVQNRVVRGQWLTRHDISIDADHQRIHFLAEVKPPVGLSASEAGKRSKYSLKLPTGARLLDWQYAASGDTPVSPSRNPDEDSTSKTGSLTREDSWDVLQQGGRTVLYFDAPARGFVVEMDASLPHQPDHPTAIGWIELDRVSERSILDDPLTLEQVHELQITRSVTTELKWIQKVKTERVTGPAKDAAALLTAGEVLQERYVMTGPVDASVHSARFRTRRLNRPFDVDSRITLRWEDGRWTAQSDFKITSKHGPDYIDIAVPTRWCDTLQIEPVCVSSRQPTLDPSMQVIRIDLQSAPSAVDTVPDVVSSAKPAGTADPATNTTASGPQAAPDPIRNFRLISRLAVSEVSRVSVPEMKSLGARRHRIDVIVPTRLTNEEVRWRSNFAGPIEKPRWPIDSPMRMPPDSALSVYAVTAPQWSIDLETLPRTDRLATCLHTDHRVLVRPQDSRAIMITRFDVLPGDQPFVRLAISRSAEVLGVWAATRPADLRPIDQDDTELARWELPLPLSRLSQTVEVLAVIDVDRFTADDDYVLPELEGMKQSDESTFDWSEIPARHSAFTANAENDWMRTPIDPATRSRILASSVVRAIASSSDAFADRRDEEVAAWLRPWITRYHQLVRTAGRELGMDWDEQAFNPDPQPDPTEGTPAKQVPAVANEEIDVADPQTMTWEKMDRFILNQESRYFPTDDQAFSTDPDPSSSNLKNIAGGSPTWTDFLSLSNPPGYLNRWTFRWSDASVPIAKMAFQRQQMTPFTRQQVMRGCMFVGLASLLFVSVMIPPRRPITPIEEQDDRQVHKTVGVTLRLQTLLNHPASWLFVLGGIGLLLIPLPMALGLMLASLVLIVFGFKAPT